MDIDIERLKVDAAYWDEVAPEGATHYVEDDCVFPWRKREDAEYYNRNGGWVRLPGPHSDGMAVSRPTQWSGDGLPPVGCKCRMRPSFGCFEEVTITYMGDGVFCYRSENGSEHTGSIGDHGFIPLKSDKERVLEAAMNASCHTLKTGATPKQMFESLYDAGLLTIPKA